MRRPRMPLPFLENRPSAAILGTALIFWLGAPGCKAGGDPENLFASEGGTSGSSGLGSGGSAVGTGGTSAASGFGGTGALPASGGALGAGGSSSHDGSATLPASELALSDGFETAASGGPPDAAMWSVVSPDCSGAGKLSIDGSVAHTGSQSVRIDGGGGYCDHVFISNAPAIASVGKQIYARFFLRLSDALGGGHTSFLAMKDDADGGKNVRMGGQNGVLMYNRESDDATLPSMSPAGVAMSLMPPIAPAWSCVEFHFDEDAGTIDTWVDEKEVPGLVENGTATPDGSAEWLRVANWKPSLSDFRLGWESYGGQTMTLWFDDVAIASQRIHCET